MGFTYMVMYSVRARSHLDISDYLSPPTLCLTAPRNARSPYRRFTQFAPIYSSLPFLSAVLLSRRDIVIHYSILRHHEFLRDDILIVCCAATRQHTVGIRRRGTGVDARADSGDKVRRPRGREYNSMYNV